VRSSYFIQSAHTIYLCMGMAIYLSYLLLEVVMLIRITILNRFNRNLQSPRKRLENCSSTGKLDLDRLGIQVERRGEVVYRHTSLYADVIWNNVRMIRMRTK
jgi:hypothetical protein